MRSTARDLVAFARMGQHAAQFSGAIVQNSADCHQRRIIGRKATAMAVAIQFDQGGDRLPQALRRFDNGLCLRGAVEQNSQIATRASNARNPRQLLGRDANSIDDIAHTSLRQSLGFGQRRDGGRPRPIGQKALCNINRFSRL